MYLQNQLVSLVLLKLKFKEGANFLIALRAVIIDNIKHKNANIISNPKIGLLNVFSRKVTRMIIEPVLNVVICFAISTANLTASFVF